MRREVSNPMDVTMQGNDPARPDADPAGLEANEETDKGERLPVTQAVSYSHLTLVYQAPIQRQKTTMHAPTCGQFTLERLKDTTRD